MLVQVLVLARTHRPLRPIRIELRRQKLVVVVGATGRRGRQNSLHTDGQNAGGIEGVHDALDARDYFIVCHGQSVNVQTKHSRYH